LRGCVGSANENAQVKEIKLPILLDSRLDDWFLDFLGLEDYLGLIRLEDLSWTLRLGSLS
jgi:hypothetical protein